MRTRNEGLFWLDVTVSSSTIPGATYFFTLNNYRRQALLTAQSLTIRAHGSLSGWTGPVPLRCPPESGEATSANDPRAHGAPT